MVVAPKWKTCCIQGTPALQGWWDCKLMTGEMNDNILNCVAGNVVVGPHFSKSV